MDSRDVIFTEQITVIFDQLDDGSWVATYENDYDAQGLGATRWDAFMNMVLRIKSTLSDDHN